MTRPTEPQLRTAISIGQWSTSWLIAVALVVVILGIPVPAWLSDVAGWAFGVLAPTFLVAGMVLCWRLPDARKWLALVVNVFLVLCGVGLFHYVVERDRAQSTDATLSRIHESAAYVTAKGQYDAQVTALANLSAREFTQEYRTAFLQNEAAKSAAQAEVERLAAELVKLEGAPPADVVSGSVAFDVLGRQNAGLVQGIILAILALGNEVIALALSWRGKAAQGQPVAPQNARASVAAVVAQPDRTDAEPEDGTPKMTVEEFMDMRMRLARDSPGRVIGYRQIIAAFEAEGRRLSARWARVLNQESIERGLVRSVQPAVAASA